MPILARPGPLNGGRGANLQSGGTGAAACPAAFPALFANSPDFGAVSADPGAKCKGWQAHCCIRGPHLA
jgi:hypothetical protein